VHGKGHPSRKKDSPKERHDDTGIIHELT
jgi:hypothetical protein